mmetsp:Transcript_35212/g.109643  ORF Transcript_35212/g.109643 Transcript_35212/m.109643 type:complete len:234 (-) Transcript_35212:688-1389(-)
MLLLSSSMSHQFLCSSSSFCSAMSRKIIFWIMLLTSSKGPLTRAASSSAKRAKALEWTSRASLRKKFTTRARGSSFWRSMVTGDGGGTGLEGLVVLTPVTCARISMPAWMAFISRALISWRSVHSDFFIVHDCSVLLRASVSALRSAFVSLRVDVAVASSDCTSPRSVVFSVLVLPAALMALSRAAFARSKAFCEFVSALVPSKRSSSNFVFSSFKSSMTLPDLNVYFFSLAW